MTHSAPDVHTVAGMRERFDAGRTLTNDEVQGLFQIIDALHRGRTKSALVRLSPEEITAFAAVHNTLLQALRRAGLHLQRVTPTDDCGLPWVWFYRWSGSTRQGPFGTLDAAIGSAILQLRSGALHKKR